jgi:DNA-binding beta-propeller fold protein YncE
LTGIAYDPVDERMYVTNQASNTVSILLLSPANVCQDSGFDSREIRTYQSNGQTIEQITCVNFVGECSGEIEDGEYQ